MLRNQRYMQRYQKLDVQLEDMLFQYQYYYADSIQFQPPTLWSMSWEEWPRWWAKPTPLWTSRASNKPWPCSKPRWRRELLCRKPLKMQWILANNKLTMKLPITWLPRWNWEEVTTVEQVETTMSTRMSWKILRQGSISCDEWRGISIIIIFNVIKIIWIY